MMMTSDFILPASTLNVVPGPPVLPNTIRVWDFKQRTIVKTIEAPEAVGTMDVKMIPRDIRGRAYTAGMFNGLIYLVDSRWAQRHQRSIPTRRGECHRSFSSPAAVRVAAFPGEEFRGHVEQIAAALDPATQALAVRIGLDNPKDRLRPGMAATVALEVATPDCVLSVPESAVVDTGSKTVVFVEASPGVFEGRAVVLGRRSGDLFPVLDGLAPGERIAAAGAFLIDAETRLNPPSSTTD